MSIQDEFIATVSHEMRTPLTSIRGFSQTLLNSWDKIGDDDKKKFIGIIEEQSNRLIHLDEDILSISKMNVENQVMKKVYVNDSISKVISLVSEQYKGRLFKTNFTEKNAVARLDEDKFQQIMTNLIDNAAKYSKKDVVISTEIKNDSVIIKVRDFGVGIKSEDFDKVFKKFSRLENHLTGKTQGNGLGLYITKELVTKMGGKISFESKENEGTTYKLEFPIYNQEKALRCSQISWL